MKKLISILLAVCSLASITAGCVPSENVNNTDTPTNFWNDFYKQKEKKVTVPESAEYTKASYGYTDSAVQGFNRWYYYSYDGSRYSELTYDTTGNKWTDENTEIGGKLMRSGANSLAVRGFKSTITGVATICGNIATTNGAEFSVFVNDTQIYPSEGTLSVSAEYSDGIYFEVETELKKGDFVYFRVDGEAECNPTVRYGEYEEILYQVPDWNFYGDVHPFYHDGTMYMYNLQAYLEDVGNERYLWCLHTSTDMFNYEETDYYVPPFVQNHYNSTLEVYESIFDKQTFPYGSRDMFLFFDEGAQRYIYFGLCYYKDKSSCLGCRVSDDETGMKWSQPMFPLRDFPVACDPECSQALYINDRWYIVTSIWGQSIHSVGRPTYYIGDKGKNFLENDWSDKQPHYLDGEDLCAAQLVDVGSGKWLMYGWIPKTSYTNTEEIYFDGTRDHGLWGGNINVAREVYQNGDGTLSTRIDGRMGELLSRGALYANKSPVINSKLGDFGRSYVKFDFEVQNAVTGTKVGYLMKAEEKSYYVTLEQRSDGAYMSVTCPQDTGHPVASQMRIGDTVNGKHNVRIIVDRSVTEFFLDGKFSLTARTSMFGGNYEGYLTADGNVSFSNLEIDKLAHIKDVYD